MQSDERSLRVAVVADDLVNGGAGALGVLPVLERAGWGAVLLPPSWYPDHVAGQLVIQTAEHIEEFLRHGYDVVCIGDCERLTEPLGQLGLPLPDTITPADPDELSELLLARPQPRASAP